MRVMLLIAGCAAVLALVPSAGQAYQGPWCAVQDVGSGSMREDCSYQTFEECRPEVIAGNRGFCRPNPRWQGAAAAPTGVRKHRVRHHR